MKMTLEKEDIHEIAHTVAEILKPHLGNTQREEDIVFDVKGIASYLHVSESWVYERSRLNEIPKTKPYGVLLFRKKDIDKWLEKHSTPSVNIPPKIKAAT
ncbi:MAG: helix-turn-helix domain-containing protein [Thermodesulfovibrionales bacterium]|nr:helix-turn-helix domain-containing protein [Thermodesulfovibrionales bacterium]